MFRTNMFENETLQDIGTIFKNQAIQDGYEHLI